MLNYRDVKNFFDPFNRLTNLSIPQYRVETTGLFLLAAGFLKTTNRNSIRKTTNKKQYLEEF